MIGIIVSNRLATYYELQEVYSFEDALDFLEIINVRSYNEWVAADAAKRKR